MTDHDDIARMERRIKYQPHRIWRTPPTASDQARYQACIDFMKLGTKHDPAAQQALLDLGRILNGPIDAPGSDTPDQAIRGTDHAGE